MEATAVGKRTIADELEIIRQAAGGVLHPSEVVAYAENPDTALHSKFQWDDTEAAYQYRLWQAREIIRVEVTVVPGTKSETRAFVSLVDDRTDGGGYRDIATVMMDKGMRESLLTQARADMNRFRLKYRVLAKELAPVFLAMEQVAPEPEASAQ